MKILKISINLYGFHFSRVKYLIVLLISLSTMVAHAQEDDLQDEQPILLTEDYNRLIFKFFPFSFFDFHPSVQAGLEYRYAPAFSAEFSMGYILPYQWIFIEENDSRWGGLYRLEKRFYYNRKYNEYIGFNIMHKFLLTNYYRPIGFECDFFDCAYFKYSDYTLMRNVVTANFIVGQQVGKKRILVDLFLGIGIRWSETKIHGSFPPDASLFKRGWGRNFETYTYKKSWLPNFALGLKLGFVWKKSTEFSAIN